MIGFLMIALGLLILASTLYHLIKIGVSGYWYSYVVDVLYLIGGSALIYYGYRQEYPPTILSGLATGMTAGGRSRWF